MLHPNEIDKSEKDDKSENSTENIRRNSSLSHKSRATSAISLNKNVNGVDENPKNSKEEGALMKELEVSSKKTIKGSLLSKYLESSNVPCTLALLCTLFLITQIIANTADVWVSYW